MAIFALVRAAHKQALWAQSSLQSGMQQLATQPPAGIGGGLVTPLPAIWLKMLILHARRVTHNYDSACK